ncbi:hypothetical protein RFN58_02540 [Streptomyces iakyrus]|nr:hypothetical protein [Streptomyces iakyrus]
MTDVAFEVDHLGEASVRVGERALVSTLSFSTRPTWAPLRAAW